MLNRWWSLLHRRPSVWVAVGIVVGHAALMAGVAAAGRWGDYAFASLDATEYYQLAQSLCDHFAFGVTGPSGEWSADTWRTPGYPAFLALVMTLVGRSPAALIAVQHLLGMLSTWLIFSIASRHMSTRRAGLVTLLFFLEPYHHYYSFGRLSTSLFVALLLVTWYAWERALEMATWRRACLWSLCAGLLVLVRPIALFVPVFLVAGWMVGQLRGDNSGGETRSRGRRIVLSCAVLATACAAPAAWMFRNLDVAGRFALSSQRGVVLAYFKAAEVTLWQEGRTRDRYLETSLDEKHAHDRHPVWESIDRRLQARFPQLDDAQRAELSWPNLAQGNKTDLDSFTVSDALTAIGWNELLADPWSTLVCSTVRCVSMLTFPINLALEPPTGMTVKPWRSVATGSVYLLLLVGLLIRLLRGGLQFEVAYFPIACAAAPLLATIPQLDPRFRVPMIPMLVFIALMPSVRISSRHDSARCRQTNTPRRG